MAQNFQVNSVEQNNSPVINYISLNKNEKYIPHKVGSDPKYLLPDKNIGINL